ncbi:unnamed protein product [Scytosiphon promiscuus]
MIALPFIRPPAPLQRPIPTLLPLVLCLVGGGDGGGGGGGRGLKRPRGKWRRGYGDPCFRSPCLPATHPTFAAPSNEMVFPSGRSVCGVRSTPVSCDGCVGWPPLHILAA